MNENNRNNSNNPNDYDFKKQLETFEIIANRLKEKMTARVEGN